MGRAAGKKISAVLLASPKCFMYLCKRVTLADMKGAAQFRSIADTPMTIFRMGGGDKPLSHNGLRAPYGRTHGFRAVGAPFFVLRRAGRCEKFDKIINIIQVSQVNEI